MDRPVVKLWTRDGAVYRHAVSGGTVTDYTALNFEMVRNEPGTWSLSLPMVGLQGSTFLRLGKKAWVTFDLPGRGVRFTGRVDRMMPYRGDDGQQVLEVSGVGAFAVLHLLCYPDPDGPADRQVLVRYTDKGPTEDILRRLIVRNLVDRRKAPVTVASSAGRGKAGDVLDLFFDPLMDVVSTKATAAGIGVRVGLVDTAPAATTATMRVEFYGSRDRRTRASFSLASRTLRSWKQEAVAPTATRAVVAGAHRERTYSVDRVTLVDNTFHLTADHQLKTGDVVRFSGRVDPPAPLQASQAYFAIRTGAATFKVAAMRWKALQGTHINLTDAGQPVESVSTVGNAITLSSGDVPATGDRVTIVGTGTAPAPLAKDTTYFAIRVDRNTFRVASTAANAAAGTSISLTSTGSGQLRVVRSAGMKVTEVTRTVREVTHPGTAEADWDRVSETFVDARNVSEDEANEDVYATQGLEALGEHVEQGNAEVVTVESEFVRFGTGDNQVYLNDVCRLQLIEEWARDERVTAAKVAVTRTEGMTIELVFGNAATTPLKKQAELFRAVVRGQRKLQRGE